MGYYAQIDFCYMMLEQLKKEISKPVSVIERMIDETAKNKKGETYSQVKNREVMDAAISYVKTIIDCKKAIEADYATDIKFLEALKSTQQLDSPVADCK